MYAKNNEVPRKFDYPYQKQQRVSGVLLTDQDRSKKSLSCDVVQAIEESMKHLVAMEEKKK